MTTKHEKYPACQKYIQRYRDSPCHIKVEQIFHDQLQNNGQGPEQGTTEQSHPNKYHQGGNNGCKWHIS